jgi:hypothetical protein
MSTSKKNVAAMTAIFSTVGGALALATGIHSMGAAAATLAGVSLVVPPIGMIIAGVALLLFATYLSLRVTCATNMNTFIEDNTKKGRAALQQIDTFIEDNTKNERAALQQVESDFRKAEEAFTPLQPLLDDARRVHQNCSAACLASATDNFTSRLNGPMSPEKLQSLSELKNRNQESLEKAATALQKIETTDTLEKEATYKQNKAALNTQQQMYSHAKAAAREKYLNR